MNCIEISGRRIGANYPPLIIAEVGINHDGDFDKAIKMVADAHDAGCECVKFQCHVIEDEMSPEAKKVIPGNAEISIWDIMERAQLSLEEEIKLKTYVESKGMIYLSTPFSRAAADRLESMGVDAYKVGSGECNNYPLLKHIASFGKPIILSTGMNDIDSIKKSVAILENANVQYALLHCTSVYPTPYDKVRLGAMLELQKEFSGAVVGLSDHTLNNYCCYGAVALGASIIERHYTSDKSWAGPDIEISMDPCELKKIIEGSNAIHKALGGTKEILVEEQVTIDFAYATVVAIKDIDSGDTLTKENIWVKRPGTGGIKAEWFEKLLGEKIGVAVKSGEHLRESDIIGDVFNDLKWRDKRIILENYNV